VITFVFTLLLFFILEKHIITNLSQSYILNITQTQQRNKEAYKYAEGWNPILNKIKTQLEA